MSKKLNSHYDKTSTACNKLKSAEIVKKYELTQVELQILRSIYNKQLPLETISEMVEHTMTKKDFQKTWSSLKKKGLVYEVEEVVYDSDWNDTGEVIYMGIFGTEIHV